MADESVLKIPLFPFQPFFNSNKPAWVVFLLNAESGNTSEVFLNRSEAI